MDEAVRTEAECEWTLKRGIFYTSCLKHINDDDTNFDWKFCPFCGKTLYSTYPPFMENPHA
jgi:hypothetical protein